MIQLARRTFVISTQLVSPGSRNNSFFDIVLMCRLCNFDHLSFSFGESCATLSDSALPFATGALAAPTLPRALAESVDLYLISGIRKQFIRIKAVRLCDFLPCRGSH